MKRILLYLGFLVSSLLLSNQADASHLMGGQITWECTTSGQYIFTFRIYKDCAGNVGATADAPNAEYGIYNVAGLASNSITINTSLNAINDLAPVCRGGVAAQCNPGGGPGTSEVIREYIRVSNPITIPGVPPAAGWVITYDNRTRNANDNILNANAAGFTLRAKIFNNGGTISGQCVDNSPIFREDPSSVLCLNQSYTYNHNATDPEFDSLAYDWARPMGDFAPGTYNEGVSPAFLAFQTGFSFTNPFPGSESLNNETGEISTNINATGAYTTVIKVTAYKCSEKVAEIYRELQSFVSANCTVGANNQPNLNAPFRDGLGNLTKYDTTVKAGALIRANVQITDFPAAGQTQFDSIKTTATGSQWGAAFKDPNTGCANPPCAIMDINIDTTIFSLNPVNRIFEWQTDCNHVLANDLCLNTANTYNFVITATDDACPLPLARIATLTIKVEADSVIDSPLLNCVNVLSNGDVSLNWELTRNVNNSFAAWLIYASDNENGPFTVIDSVKTYGTNTYTEVGAGADTKQRFYHVRSRSGCKGSVINIARDTVSTIFLTANTNPTNIDVNWNSLSNPNPSGSAAQYRVFREYPIGSGFNLYQNTAATSITESFIPCTDDVNYRVELVNSTGSCTSSSNILNYTFKFPDPQTDFSFPNNQCPGTPINFTNNTTIAGGTVTYSWNFGDGSAVSTATNPTHTYASAGIFNVTLTATSGQTCDSVLTKQILVTLPTADAGADQSICPGGSASIGSLPVAGMTYSWTPTAGLSSASIANPSASPSNTSTYTVVVTDVNGCSSSDPVTITVVPFPVADAGANTSVCLGSGIGIGGGPTGPVGANYSWSPGIGLSSTSVANPTATPTTTTTYTVTVTVGTGTTCSSTDQVTVTVSPLPTADAGLSETYCMSTANVTLPTIGGSPTSTTPNVTYSWSPASTLPDPTLSNPLPSINIPSFPFLETYTVTVTSNAGCTATSTVTFGLNQDPIADVSLTSPTSICLGETVQLDGTAGFVNTNSQITWTSNFSNTPPEIINNNIISTSATPAVNTTYTLEIIDANILSGVITEACSSSASVAINVNSLPTVNAGTDQTICAGTNATIGGSPTSNAAGATFAWSNSASLSNASIANPIASPNTTTTYTVTVTDGNGCSATDQVVVTVNALPVADAGADQQICGTGTVTIGGSPTGPAGSTFAWSPSTGLSNTVMANPTANPTITTTYTVTVTDANGCSQTDDVLVSVDVVPSADAGADRNICIGQVIAIGGSPVGPVGATFAWSSSIGSFTSTASNPTVSPTSTRVYTVTVTSSNGCTATDLVTVNVNPLPSADAGLDQVICNGTPVQIGGAPTTTSVGATFMWDNAASLSSVTSANPNANPTTTTTYTVTVTSLAGCTSTDQVLVTVNSNPTADAGTAQTICSGQPATLGGAPTGTPGSTFQWDNAASLNNATAANPVATPTVTTTYSVTVTSGVNCTATDNVTITVLPVPTVDAGADQTICFGESQLIGGMPTSTTVGATFTWDNAATLDNASIANPTATPFVTTTYSVIVTHPNGCTSTDAVVVNVNALPAANAGPDLPLCNGASVQIGGSPTGPVGSTFLWDNAATLTSTTVANPTANPTVNTTYSVTVTDANGCTDVDNMTITVGSLPVVNAGADQTICENATIQIGGAPTSLTGVIFNWDNAGTLNDATIANPDATPLVTTTYTVTVSDVAGCSQTDQITITVIPNPVADAGTDQTICNGNPVQIGGMPTSTTPGAIFAWDNAGTLTDATIANPLANPSMNTVYTVTVTHPNGCTTTDDVLVSVNGLPTADAGVDFTLCNGDSRILGGTPTGPTGSTFAWDNATSLDDATNSNPSANPTSTTTYTVTITDANGCSNTDQVLITVLPLADVDAGADRTICEGLSTPIGGSPTSTTAGVTFAWDNATTLTDASNANPTASPIVTTTYTVTVTHPNGCTSMDQMQVIVNPAPIVDAGTDQDLCINSSTSIGGSPTGPIGSSYVWDNAGTLNDATNANPSANPLVTTTYSVTVTDVNGCTNTDNVTITINALPTTDAGADQTICNKETATLGGAPTGPIGSTYAWDNATTLLDATVANPIASPSTTTTYTVTVTDVNGCIDSDQVTITVNPLPNVDAGMDQDICNLKSVTIGGAPTSSTSGVTYAWDNGASLDDATTANPIASPNVTTSYRVTVTETVTGCSDTASILIRVNPLPVVDFTSANLCLNDLTQFTDITSLSAGTISSWTWDFGDGVGTSIVQNPSYQYTSAGTYQVKLIVTTAIGCEDSITKPIIVSPLPNVDAGTDQTICNTASVTIGGTPTSTTVGVSYIWDNAITLNDPTSANPIASPSVTTRYKVTVTETATGCFDTASVVVNVNPIPVVDFNASSTCINELTSFTDASSISTGTLQSWIWDFGDGIGTAAIQNPTYQYLSAGSYQVKLIVESVLGCRDSITKTVVINPIPVVDFASVNLCLNDVTQFTDASSIPTGVLQTWTWDFGDGVGVSVLQNPSYTYTTAGTFNVKLVVESGFGCKDSITKQLIINPLPTVDAGMDQVICNAGTVTLGGSPTSTTIGVTYLWDNAASLNDATASNPDASPMVTTRYKITVTETATGCFDTSSVLVIVNPTPVVDFTFTNQCLNDMTMFTDATTLSVGTFNSWTWDFGDGVGTSIVQNPSYQFTAAGTFDVKLIVETTVGCLDSITKQVVINPLPVVDAGADQAICLTDSAMLGGAPTGPIGATYVWDNASTLSNPTIENPMAGPTSTTTYSVTVTDLNGCVDIDQITITVNPLPNVNFNNSQTCAGNAMQFTDLSNIVAPSTVQGWLWDFGDGIGTSMLQNPTYLYAAAGTYSVKLIAISSQGCSDSLTQNVVVDVLPIADAGADRTICELDTTPLGKPTVVGETYLWNNPTTLTDATLAQPGAFPSVTTTYSVTVTNANGCTSSDAVEITVTPAPNVNAGPDITICNNDMVQIGGSPTSTDVNASYLWDNAATLDDPTLANPMASPSDTTEYIVTVTDILGCSSTDTMVVNVNPVAMVDFEVDRASRCESQFAAFTDISTVSAGSIVAWSWDFGDGIGTSTLQNPGYQYATAGTYSVLLEVQTALGCIDSVRKDVIILPLPVAFAGADIAICIGDTITLGGNPTSQAGSFYAWSPGFDLSSVSDSNPRAYPTSSTIYYLTVTGANGCFNYDTIDVDVNALPLVIAEKNDTVCVDAPVQLSATGALSYTWSPSSYLDDATIANPIARAFKNTQYVAFGTDVNGCVGTDTVDIEVFNLDFNPVDTLICSGDSVVLTPVLQGDTTGISYLWSSSDANYILSDPTNMSVKVTAGSRQYFSLQIQNGVGCVDQDSVYLNMKQAAEVDFDYLNSPRCSGSIIEIQNMSTYTDDYIWKLNGQIVSRVQNPAFEINNLIDNTITLIGSNLTCTDSTSETINSEGLRSLLQLKDANVFTPNGDGINDIFDPGFEGEFIGCVGFQIFDRWGAKVFDSNIGQYGWDGVTLRGVRAPAGMYYYVIVIANEEIRGSVYLSR